MSPITGPEGATGPNGRAASGGSLLEVEGLAVELFTGHGPVRVVDEVSFRVDEGETFGLVGESGSGKTVTSLAVLGMIGPPTGRVPEGSVRLEGRELRGLPPPELQRIRGREISMIFQEPRRSLDPAFTVGDQIAETVRAHLGLSRRDAWQKAVEMVELVGIGSASRRAHDYPHQFSGGMAQRVMLAIALCCSPKVLIADEPTTALDVTVQAQVLDLIRDLQDELGLAVLFISHDLGVIAEMCDRVAVMYAGQIVEQAPVDDLFLRPQHPYTAALLQSIPSAVITTAAATAAPAATADDTTDAADATAAAKDGAASTVGGAAAPPTRLTAIPGVVPAAHAWPSGCRFHPRCPHAVEQCRLEPPPLTPNTPPPPPPPPPPHGAASSPGPDGVTDVASIDAVSGTGPETKAGRPTGSSTGSCSASRSATTVGTAAPADLAGSSSAGAIADPRAAAGSDPTASSLDTDDATDAAGADGVGGMGTEMNVGGRADTVGTPAPADMAGLDGSAGSVAVESAGGRGGVGGPGGAGGSDDMAGAHAVGGGDGSVGAAGIDGAAAGRVVRCLRAGSLALGGVT